MASSPLFTTSETQLRCLVRTLWGGDICGDRHDDQASHCLPSCPFEGPPYLSSFFKHVKQLTRLYAIASDAQTSPAVRSHDELLAVISVLQENSGRSRDNIREEAFKYRSGSCKPTASDEEKLINLAVRISCMISCSSHVRSSNFLEMGLRPKIWNAKTTFEEFLLSCFPYTDHGTFSNDSHAYVMGSKGDLTAYALKSRTGMKFRPTDDIRQHLKFDQADNIVHIFHHVGFLKAQLRSSLPKSSSLGVKEKRMSLLPRQLLLETLDSVQRILFAELDEKSHALLRILCSSSHFDPECLRYESSSLRTPEENDVVYYYWGARLADLNDELENPTPRGYLQIWLEKKSGARYVMLATLIGVVFAVVLGMASLAVGVYQAWIGYQAWKHPVQA